MACPKKVAKERPLFFPLPFSLSRAMGKRSKGAAAAAAAAELTSPQKAAQAEARVLQRAAVSAGILTPDKPDQFPRLAPNKGASRSRRTRAQDVHPTRS
jgi:hypothetical protein